MRTHYNFPSGDYIIVLSEEELEQIIKRDGLYSIRVNRTPCTTQRSIYNSEEGMFEFLDRKEIENDLRFCTHETVGDIKEGYHNVQFLNIAVERGQK